MYEKLDKLRAELERAKQRRADATQGAVGAEVKEAENTDSCRCRYLSLRRSSWHRFTACASG